MTFYHWLEVEGGLWFTVVGWVVTGILAFAAGRFSKTWKLLRSALWHQQVIADRLDVSTPGGLHEVVKVLDQRLPATGSPAAAAGKGSGKDDHRQDDQEPEQRVDDEAKNNGDRQDEQGK